MSTKEIMLLSTFIFTIVILRFYNQTIEIENGNNNNNLLEIYVDISNFLNRFFRT